MKVIPTPKSNYGAQLHAKNLSVPQSNFRGQVAKDSVSFGSSKTEIANKLKSGFTGIFEYIEKTGFFIEFLIVDTFSMMAPRTWVGLLRDKDKTGQYNYKAAAEEAGREISSGPTMNLIPMAIAALVTKFNPASHMETGVLDKFNEMMKGIVQEAKNSGALTDKASLDKILAGKIFDEAYKDSNATKPFKEDFINLLLQSTETKPKPWYLDIFSKEHKFGEHAAAFSEKVEEINNQASKDIAPSSPKGVRLAEKTHVNACDLFGDFHYYSKDIIDKLTNKDFIKSASEGFKGDAFKWLESAQKSRGQIKLATALSAFFAVGGFLLCLPKLYQRGKVSPAEESAKRAKAEVGGAHENN